MDIPNLTVEQLTHNVFKQQIVDLIKRYDLIINDESTSKDDLKWLNEELEQLSTWLTTLNDVEISLSYDELVETLTQSQTKLNEMAQTFEQITQDFDTKSTTIDETFQTKENEITQTFDSKSTTIDETFQTKEDEITQTFETKATTIDETFQTRENIITQAFNDLGTSIDEDFQAKSTVLDETFQTKENEITQTFETKATAIDEVFETKATALDTTIENAETKLNDGSFDGKSSYDLAVENGFTGSVEEYLSSLNSKPVEMIVNVSLGGSVAAGKTNRIFEHIVEKDGFYIFLFYYTPNPSINSSLVVTPFGGSLTHGNIYNGSASVGCGFFSVGDSLFVEILGWNNGAWSLFESNLSIARIS